LTRGGLASQLSEFQPYYAEDGALYGAGYVQILLVGVAGQDVSSLGFTATLDIIRSSSRPLTVSFQAQKYTEPVGMGELSQTVSAKVQSKFQKVIRATGASFRTHDNESDSDSDRDSDSDTDSDRQGGDLQGSTRPVSFVEKFDRDNFKRVWLERFQSGLDPGSLLFSEPEETIDPRRSLPTGHSESTNGGRWAHRLDHTSSLVAYQSALAVIVGGDLQAAIEGQPDSFSNVKECDLHKRLAIDEVWENERSIFGSWSGTHLLPTERGLWSDRDGNTLQGLNAVGLPQGQHGYQWSWVNTWEPVLGIRARQKLFLGPNKYSLYET
jgi:hypothetical protein